MDEERLCVNVAPMCAFLIMGPQDFVGYFSNSYQEPVDRACQGGAWDKDHRQARPAPGIKRQYLLDAPKVQVESFWIRRSMQ